MKFSPSLRVTHIGFAVETDSTSENSADPVVVKRYDEATLRASVARVSIRDSNSFKQLARLVDLGVGPAYMASAEDGSPILAALRIPGGPKTAAHLRSHLGPALPYVGEREHLLAEIWVAKSATPAGVSAALGALAFLDPPSNLARTLILVPKSSRRQSVASISLQSSLAGTGFTPYIHAVSQFTWKHPWRRRVDWIGPPPPARSVISSTGIAGAADVAEATSTAEAHARTSSTPTPLTMPSQLSQEITS